MGIMSLFIGMFPHFLGLSKYYKIIILFWQLAYLQIPDNSTFGKTQQIIMLLKILSYSFYYFKFDDSMFLKYDISISFG